MATRADDPPCWVGMTTRYHRGMQILHNAVRAGELGEMCWWSICEFTLYNYGMIPAPQMAWISAAASAVQPAASPSPFKR